MQFNLPFFFLSYIFCFSEVNSILLFHLSNVLNFCHWFRQTLHHCLNILSGCSDRSARLQVLGFWKVSPVPLSCSSLNCSPSKPVYSFHLFITDQKFLLCHPSPFLGLLFPVSYFFLLFYSLGLCFLGGEFFKNLSEKFFFTRTFDWGFDRIW